MDKKLSLTFSGGRYFQETPKGFDSFLNPVIDEQVEMTNGGQQNNTRMVAI